MSTCIAIVDETRARVLLDTDADEIELVNSAQDDHVFARTIVCELVRALETHGVTRLIISATAHMLKELREVSRGHSYPNVSVDETSQYLGMSRSEVIDRLRLA